MSAASPASVPPIGSAEFFKDPYPTYRALLDSGTRVVRLSPHIVAVTHYRDCLDILRDPRLSAKRYVRQIAHFSEEQKRQIASWTRASGNMMFFMDAPSHTRVRRLLMGAFSPEAVAAIQPRIRRIFLEILEGLPTGVEIDFMGRVAHLFPALVIGEILGVPRGNWDRLMKWSDDFIDFIATFQAPFDLALRATQSLIEMLEYLQELADEKRKRPTDDVMSRMVASEKDGRTLTNDELLAQGILLLVAGHETTRNLIGNGMLTLLRHPAEMELLRSDPGLARSTVEEFLRYEGPLQGTNRVVKEEMELYGERLMPGESLLPLFGCANRDSAQFPDPDRFDPARKNNAHLDFGAGAHTCLGLHLARVETQIAIPMLLERYRRIELTEMDPEWGRALTLRGLKRLKIVLHAD
ncbi:MAG: cytochrome P450 [Acidobacteriia bacterium]|nr:cytochrome P450 [Terriglobia bacterium]